MMVGFREAPRALRTFRIDDRDAGAIESDRHCSAGANDVHSTRLKWRAHRACRIGHLFRSRLVPGPQRSASGSRTGSGPDRLAGQSVRRRTAETEVDSAHAAAAIRGAEHSTNLAVAPRNSRHARSGRAAATAAAWQFRIVSRHAGTESRQSLGAADAGDSESDPKAKSAQWQEQRTTAVDGTVSAPVGLFGAQRAQQTNRRIVRRLGSGLHR